MGVGVGTDTQLYSSGEYSGDDFPTLENFSGLGKFFNIDIDATILSVGAGYWKSEDESWHGFNFTTGTGIGVKLFDTGVTETKIEFPISTSNYMTNTVEWKTNLLESITPITNE